MYAHINRLANLATPFMGVACKTNVSGLAMLGIIMLWKLTSAYNWLFNVAGPDPEIKFTLENLAFIALYTYHIKLHIA